MSNVDSKSQTKLVDSTDCSQDVSIIIETEVSIGKEPSLVHYNNYYYLLPAVAV